MTVQVANQQGGKMDGGRIAAEHPAAPFYVAANRLGKVTAVPDRCEGQHAAVQHAGRSLRETQCGIAANDDLEVVHARLHEWANRVKVPGQLGSGVAFRQGRTEPIGGIFRTTEPGRVDVVHQPGRWPPRSPIRFH